RASGLSDSFRCQVTAREHELKGRLMTDTSMPTSEEIRAGGGPQPLTSRTVQYTGPGGYDVIVVADQVVRAPQAGEVRIRVRAAAVNPTDISLRERGASQAPIIPGMDAAGVIEAVGA